MKRNLYFSLLLIVVSAVLSAQIQAETLRQAMDEAVQTSPDVLMTTNNRLSIDQAVKQARAGYFPVIDLTAGIGKEKSENPTADALGDDGITLTRRGARLSLMQMLFDGFATSNEVARNKARVESAAWRVDGNAQDVGLRVAEVYLDVLKRQQLVKIARDNLESHRRTYNMIQKRTKSGLARKSDLIQAKGRLALSHSNLQAAQGNL